MNIDYYTRKSFIIYDIDILESRFKLHSGIKHLSNYHYLWKLWYLWHLKRLFWNLVESTWIILPFHANRTYICFLLVGRYSVLE